MRIDKFLWCVRIFKTRAQAKEACVAGKVWVNGDLAKPSRLVGEDDVIRVRKQAIDYEYDVLDIPKSRVGPALVEGLIDNITSADELHKLELMNIESSHAHPTIIPLPARWPSHGYGVWWQAFVIIGYIGISFSWP